MSKPLVIFVLGGPGAGKGTQCRRIAELLTAADEANVKPLKPLKYGYVHLCAGDILREQCNKNTPIATEIRHYMEAGNIVPVAITCSLLEQQMHEHITAANSVAEHRFLIDGFPRNQDNLDGWNKDMKDKTILQFVLFFDCSNEICISRCLARGAAGSGRKDDNKESLKKRIDMHVEDSMPIVDYFKTLGLLRRIDASVSADEVFEQVQRVFKEQQ